MKRQGFPTSRSFDVRLTRQGEAPHPPQCEGEMCVAPGHPGAKPAREGSALVLILAMLVLGLAAGWAAHLLVGRGDPNWPRLLVAGLLGSFVGGTLGSLLSGDGLELRPSGLIGSIVGATLVLLLWRAVGGKPTSTP